MRPPRDVNFVAFDSRFAITCSRRSGSPTTAPRRARLQREPQTLRFGCGPRGFDRHARERRQFHRPRCKVQLARADAAEIQQIIDHLELGPGALLDTRRDGHDLGVLRALDRQDAIPTQDRVERRAQLVRNDG